MFPEGFIQRIRSQEYIDADSLLRALKEPSPVSIRLNPSKWSRIPVGGEPVQWCASGYYLKSRPSYTLDPLFHSGCYYPQEASSMFLEEVFRQVISNEEYTRVLDLCAAPGGKSTHISSLIGSNGLLVANEVIKTRALILAENLTKWGKANTIVTQNDPSAFSSLTGFFDIVLVDAPCSGEGMFRDPAAVKEWSLENTSHCSQRQKRILLDVWPSLKENGILIYSTCTFNPDENEKNIKWLVSRNQAEIVGLNLSGFEAITEIDYQGIKGYGFFPGSTKGEGFFITVIRKSGGTASETIRIRKNSESVPNKADLEIAKEWTTFHPGNIIRFRDTVCYMPGTAEDRQVISGKLLILKGGTRICTSGKSHYVPDPELALSESIGSESFLTEELDYKQALNYLRRDNILTGAIPRGWFITTYNGINLGFCNNIGTRINNYYPVNWRIRMSLSGISAGNIISWMPQK